MIPYMTHFWRIRWARWLLLLATALAYLLALRLWVDPRPPLPPTQRTPLATELTLPAGGTTAHWLATLDPLPPTLALELTAAYAHGETDILYGWLWGTADHHLAFGISPLGYLQLEEITAEGRTLLLPLQTYPHVRQGTATNHLWLERNPAHQLTIRLNGEWVWQGPAPASGQLGLWGQSWGAPATVHFTEWANWVR